MREEWLEMEMVHTVRRIDNLGRIIIPKRIRKLLQIQGGDTMKIFIDTDGEISLKKYSSMGQLRELSQQYAETLYENTQHTILICDQDDVIAVAGASKDQYLDRQVSKMVKSWMDQRRIRTEVSPGRIEVIEGVVAEYQSYVVAPINPEGSPIGAVILLSHTPESSMRNLKMETKLAGTAASFLGKQLILARKK
jgi:AbrB family transcriptional regulator, stage V sporulation protein T